MRKFQPFEKHEEDEKFNWERKRDKGGKAGYLRWYDTSHNVLRAKNIIGVVNIMHGVG